MAPTGHLHKFFLLNLHLFQVRNEIFLTHALVYNVIV